MGHTTRYYFKDRDATKKCGVCQGPIYKDEPQTAYCPDCTRTFGYITEAHKTNYGDAPGVRVVRFEKKTGGTEMSGKCAIEDEDLLDQFRGKRLCELCCSRKYCEPHHVFGKGFGGWSRFDIAVNLLALCRGCHQGYHDGHSQRQAMLAIVARRERITAPQIEALVYHLRRQRDNSDFTRAGQAAWLDGAMRIAKAESERQAERRPPEEDLPGGL